jgi:hypothetical protein
MAFGMAIHSRGPHSRLHRSARYANQYGRSPTCPVLPYPHFFPNSGSPAFARSSGVIAT